MKFPEISTSSPDNWRLSDTFELWSHSHSHLGKTQSKMQDHELSSLFNSSHTQYSSARSSLDISFIHQQPCQVTVRDELGLGDNAQDVLADQWRIPLSTKNKDILPTALRSHLENRDPRKTRWIHFSGWSEPLMSLLSSMFLQDHGCLEVHNLGHRVLGGPIQLDNNSQFIWLRTPVWSLEPYTQALSSVKRCDLCMVICLPTPSTAGTLITHIIGDVDAVKKLDDLLTQSLLGEHAMGLDALQCVWVLALSIIRVLVAQLRTAFTTFDPLDKLTSRLPTLDEMPRLLDQTSDLARIDRYVAGLDEIVAFFDSVKSFQRSFEHCPREDPMFSVLPRAGPAPEVPGHGTSLSQISPRSTLESELAKQGIQHSRDLCRTYMRQYETLLQMVSDHMLDANTNSLPSYFWYIIITEQCKLRKGCLFGRPCHTAQPK